MIPCVVSINKHPSSILHPPILSNTHAAKLKMFTTSAILLPNMSFEDLAEQIVAVTEALELIKNLQPVVEMYDNTATKSSYFSWVFGATPKSPVPPQPYVSDLPPLHVNQHPIVLSIWVNSHSLTSYKANLSKELMDLIREKRQYARSLELGVSLENLQGRSTLCGFRSESHLGLSCTGPMSGLKSNGVMGVRNRMR